MEALKASTFSSSLEFVLGSDTVSALVPGMGSIANLQFKDFSFENSAVHTLLHGRWTASYVESKQCGETLNGNLSLEWDALLPLGLIV